MTRQVSKMDRKKSINILSLRRQNAIGTLGNLPREANYTAKNVLVDEISAYDMAIEALQEPQVGGWIPVTERLPEDGYGVLVTVNGKHNNIAFENALEIAEYDNIEGWIIEGYLDWLDPDVIAWQPLPEPYKGEKD